MRKVIYSMMVSLDGFIEGPNRELDWVTVDEELHKYINDRQSAIDTYLYGRWTYEVIVDYWPTADTNPSNPEYVVEFAHIWKNMPKIVFSRTLEQAEWNTRVVRENIAEEIAKLKAHPGKDLALGGADIASTFMQFGLLDEYWLYVQPVVLGSGTPMFRALDKINLRLVETRTFDSGVVLLRYRRADEGQERLIHAGYDDLQQEGAS
jgi:dihydrofolate reductase